MIKAHPEPPYVKPAPERLLEELVSKFGVPSYKDKNGNPCKINERFWVELLAIERHIIHDRDEDKFYVYNPSNGLWEKQTAHALKGSLSDRMRLANREWEQCSRIMPLDNERNRRDIISLLRGVVEKQDFFENRPPAIHAQNCMIVFEHGQPERVSFSPDFRSRNQLSVAYDPDAQCRQFKEDLIRPAMSGDDMGLLQKMFGLLVLGINRPQRIFILSGEPKTGKTTLGLIIQHLIGKRNCVELRTDLLGERFEMGRAIGKMMYFGPDVDSHFLQSKGAHRLKSIVGGDPMDAEKKNSNNGFPFEGILNVLITSNSRLIVRLRGDYGAWHRRLVIINYNGKPPQKRIEAFDRRLVEKEGSGILNFAIEGIVKYEKDCSNDGDIYLTPEQINRVTALLSESDGLRNYLRSELIGSDEGDLTVEEILEEYAAFARQKGWQILSTQVLQGQLKDLMLEFWGITPSHSVQRDKKSLRGYRGIRFRQNGDEDPSDEIPMSASQ